jgi:hypothetical protein
MLVANIAGGIRQSFAYLSGARVAPLETRPVSSYYAVYSLLIAMMGAVTGKVPDIQRHGMSAELTPAQTTSDLSIHPWTGEESKVGALQKIANEFILEGSRTELSGTWTLRELLGSVPEVNAEYVAVFPGHRPFTVPVEVVANERGTADVVSQQVLAQFASAAEMVSVIDAYDHHYLPAQQTPVGTLAFRRKPGVPETGWLSPTGRKFLLLTHVKAAANVSIHPVVAIVMALFGLAHLARYVPGRWSAFVRSDESGERFLIERFLTIAEDITPVVVAARLKSSMS